MSLSGKLRSELLSLAREAIAHRLDTGKALAKDFPGKEWKEKRGVFVTLHTSGPRGGAGDRQLRGCIGYVEPTFPLGEAVLQAATQAAFGDTRFSPMTKEEFPKLHLEISCLTPPRAIPGASAIRLGVDGVTLEKDGRKAVFLPQVATEQGWDLETMLSELSMKAGLDAGAWRQGARLSTFQAEVFEE